MTWTVKTGQGVNGHDHGKSCRPKDMSQIVTLFCKLFLTPKQNRPERQKENNKSCLKTLYSAYERQNYLLNTLAYLKQTKVFPKLPLGKEK
jgi:hypothetical protein